MGTHDLLIQNYPHGIYSAFCDKQKGTEELVDGTQIEGETAGKD